MNTLILHTVPHMLLFPCVCLPGLPKPAYLSQIKASSSGSTLLIVDFDAEDIIYTALPLYHTAGGVIGLFGVITKGDWCLFLTSKEKM